MKKILALLLSLALVLSLCACGGKEAASDVESGTRMGVEYDDEAEYDDEDSVIGFYKQTSGYEAETDESAALYEMLQEAGLYTYLVVCDDGTAYMDMLGDTAAMAWDDEYFYFLSDDDSEEDAASPYIYEDGVLTLTDGSEVEFTKLTEEEQEYYEENGSGSMDDLAATWENDDEDSVIGFYKQTSGFQADTEEQAAMDNMLQEAGLYMYLVVCDDGTAYLDMLGDKVSLAWDDEYFYFLSDDDSEEDDASPYIYEDGILTLTDGSGIEYTKLTEEEQEHYEEYGSGSLDDLFGAQAAG